MKFVVIEHYSKGIWYFTDVDKAANYIGVESSYLQKCINRNTQCKGWYVNTVEDYNVISKFINPEQ